MVRRSKPSANRMSSKFLPGIKHKPTKKHRCVESHSSSLTTLHVNKEDLHFFYRPIPTLKPSLLLKLQPSIDRIIDEFYYEVGVIEKCLREFFLLL